jgi:hypothetical protein
VASCFTYFISKKPTSLEVRIFDFMEYFSLLPKLYFAIIRQPQHAQQKLQQNYVKKPAILGLNTLNYDNLQLEGSKTVTALNRGKLQPQL